MESIRCSAWDLAVSAMSITGLLALVLFSACEKDNFEFQLPSDSDSEEHETFVENDAEALSEADLEQVETDFDKVEMEPDANESEISEYDSMENSAWGWISVIEWNDVCDQWYLKTQWFGGVRAYFAEEENYNRSLPHTLDWCTAKSTVGNCTLYDPNIVTDSCLEFTGGDCLCLDKGVECDENTVQWCPEDQWCVETPEIPWSRGVCRDLPRHYNVGTISLGGLKTQGALVMQPDELGRYIASGLPDKNDLFDMGDIVTATTSGGELPPLSFTARGVAPLELNSQVVRIHLTGEQPATVRWTPGDSSSRIQVVLMGGSHDPNPLAAAIVCDAPDSDGQLSIAHSLLEEFLRLSCRGTWMLKCSRITRYTRDLQSLGDKKVELFVGSARNLQLSFE